MLFNFIVAVNICNDFGAKETEIDIVSTYPPSICYKVIDLEAMVFGDFFCFFVFIYFY